METLKGFDLDAKFSFGNIGFSTNLCSKNLLDWSSPEQTIQLNFRCQASTEFDSILSSGLVEYKSLEDYEGIVNVFGSCYYEENIFAKAAGGSSKGSLMEYFDAKMFNEELLSACKGKQECQAKLSMAAIKVPTSKQTLNGQFVFAQVSCKSDEENLAQKRQIGLAVVALGFIICLFYGATIGYLYWTSKINAKLITHEYTNVRDFTI